MDSTVKIALIFVFLASGCSSAPAGNQPTPDPQNDMKAQLIDLQKNQAKQSALIDDLNNKISFLKDQLDGKSHKSSVAKKVATTKSDDLGAIPEDPSDASPENPKDDQIPIQSAGQAKIPNGDDNTPPSPAPDVKIIPMEPVKAQPYQSTKKTAGLTPVERLYQQTLVESRKPQLAGAAKTVATMLKLYKDSPLTNNALYLYAETLYQRGSYNKSAEEFERLYKLFPDGNKAVSSLYKLALCYEKMGHPAEAQEAFENIVTVYPGSREALEAQRQIMKGPDGGGG